MVSLQACRGEIPYVYPYEDHTMVYHAMVELLPIERVCTPGYLLAVVMPFKGAKGRYQM